MPAKRYRRDQSEVSCCLKYVIFGFNVIFWVSESLCLHPQHLTDSGTILLIALHLHNFQRALVEVTRVSGLVFIPPATG
ncbi:Tetraspanin-17 [Portunus trituberculatus]|uniref:Tetraspanin-17 n=1 Tax=Portunus trituberculatus TaxID=210409 RepID=A0A5B7K6E7_PORTR|nr:Tetraspanin-17 [Portunus trituberculatus]